MFKSILKILEGVFKLLPSLEQRKRKKFVKHAKKYKDAANKYTADK